MFKQASCVTSRCRVTNSFHLLPFKKEQSSIEQKNKKLHHRQIRILNSTVNFNLNQTIRTVNEKKKAL